MEYQRATRSDCTNMLDSHSTRWTPSTIYTTSVSMSPRSVSKSLAEIAYSRDVFIQQDTGKKRKPLFKQRNEDDAYDISRYQPTIKYMLEVGHRRRSTFEYS